MSHQDVCLELIEKTRSKIGSGPFLIVFLSAIKQDFIELLLEKFPQASVIVKHDIKSTQIDSRRIGGMYGIHTGYWQIPVGRYRNALVMSSRTEFGLRNVKEAYSHGVRRYVFADPISGTLSQEGILAHGSRMVMLRIAHGSRFVMARIGDAGKRYARRALRTTAGPEAVAAAGRLVTTITAKMMEPSFVATLKSLFRFADHQFRGVVRWRPQTVVLIVGALRPGGAERQVVNTALALAADRRFQPRVVCTNLTDESSAFYRNVLDEVGVEVLDAKQFDLGGAPEEHAWFVNACRMELQKPKFNITDDVIRLLVVFLKTQPGIVHSFLDDTNVKSGVAGILAGVPKIILSFRSVAPNNFALHTPMMRPGYRTLLSRPEIAFCCNSVAGAADYRQWLGKESLPIEILRNGIDLHEFAGRTESDLEARAKFGIPNGVLVLGSIIRLSEEKQPLLWAKVVVEISRNLPDMHFVLAGEGPMKDDVNLVIANARITSRVHILGHVKDVPSLMRCFDLFLLTSRLEGLPNVLIEAQAMGVPVVTTPAGGAAEALDPGHTGLVAPDQTVLGVAKTCLSILQDQNLRMQMAQAAPGFVRQKFSIEQMLQHTLQLYE